MRPSWATTDRRPELARDRCGGVVDALHSTVRRARRLEGRPRREAIASACLLAYELRRIVTTWHALAKVGL